MLFLKTILRPIKTILIKTGNVIYIIIGFVSYLFEKKVIFLIDGGLGSQMWQYAIGQAIETRCRLPVYFDVTFYKNGGKDCSGMFNRNWSIEKVFPAINVKKASVCDVHFYKRFFEKRYTHDNRVNTYIEEILDSKQPRYLGEYYSHVKYFDFTEEQLKKQFVFDTSGFSENTMRMAERIKNTECPVAVQIRRGDFVTVGADVVTPPEYFYRAIETVNESVAEKGYKKIIFFVFSNDISYCQNIFSNSGEEFVFADINDNDSGEQDMYLMTLCRHFIISASSFGWWGAFLSTADDKKIVITPEKWRTYELPEQKGRMLIDGWIGL